MRSWANRHKLVAVAVVVVVIGLIYFAIAKQPHFQVIAELPRIQFEVGEEISVRPYLINRRILPITVYSGFPLFFARVYDADNREVLHEPPAFLMILRSHTIWPHIRHYETWRRDEPFTLNFTLEQPGRYKILTAARFSLDTPGPDDGQPLHIYGEPIWIEVIPPLP